MSKQVTTPQDVPDRQRRLLLGLTAAAPLMASMGSADARYATHARIVIAGSGLGGLAVAHRLASALDGANITMIDAKQEHNYQPGYTLVGTGIWEMYKVRDSNAALMPDGVQWVQEAVARFEPDAKTVVTTSGRKIPYDYLVVATGLHLDYAQVEGMDPRLIGQRGIASVYYGPEAAQASWQVMDAFRQKGGKAVMTLPGTPMKCAGAPLKVTFMLADRLKQAGTLASSQIDFYSAGKNVFGVKPVNDNVLERWSTLGIDVHYEHKLTGIDSDSQRARFTLPDGREQWQPYDFVHVVPPMRAPDAVKSSPLAVQTGPMAAGGWLDVSKETLQHKRYPEVFGVGDINGTPRGKTAATIKKSAPIVVHNLLQVMQGKPADQVFDGYTSCPLLIREGAALLIEFDYEGKLVPSLPLIEPLTDSYMAWLMKYRLLKPAYMSVLKGRV